MTMIIMIMMMMTSSRDDDVNNNNDDEDVVGEEGVTLTGVRMPTQHLFIRHSHIISILIKHKYI